MTHTPPKTQQSPRSLREVALRCHQLIVQEHDRVFGLHRGAADARHHLLNVAQAVSKLASTLPDAAENNMDVIVSHERHEHLLACEAALRTHAGSESAAKEDGKP